MIYRLYEKILLRNLSTLPEHICFMISEKDMLDAPDNLYRTVEWCRELGIGSVTFHISTTDPARLERCLPQIRRVSSIAHLRLHYREGTEVAGEGMDVAVAIGKSGREEIAACIRQMAEEGVEPDSVDEDGGRPPDRFPDLAVGLLRTLLPGRQLGAAPEGGFPSRDPGLSVQGAPFRQVMIIHLWDGEIFTARGCLPGGALRPGYAHPAVRSLSLIRWS